MAIWQVAVVGFDDDGLIRFVCWIFQAEFPTSGFRKAFRLGTQIMRMEIFSS